MTARDFINMDFKAGTPITVTLHTQGDEHRTVRLFFRGYTVDKGKKVAHSVNELKPLFSAPNKHGGINKNYYTAINTSFDNIIRITPLS